MDPKSNLLTSESLDILFMSGLLILQSLSHLINSGGVSLLIAVSVSIKLLSLRFNVLS